MNDLTGKVALVTGAGQGSRLRSGSGRQCHRSERGRVARWLALVLLAAALPASGGLSEDDTASTRRLASRFLHELFDQQDLFGAYDRHAIAQMRQHNPNMADGLAARRAFFETHGSQPAVDRRTWANVYNLVLVDKDLFAVHHHVFSGPADSGRVFVDLWRVANGRIVEHWDVIQPLPPTAAHSNGIGCGDGNSYAAALKLQSTTRQVTCGAAGPTSARSGSVATVEGYRADLARGDIPAAVNTWFGKQFRQHNPAVRDGITGAIDYLEQQYGRGAERPRILSPQRVLADGHLVLYHRIVAYPGQAAPVAVIDIFRVDGGKITEHWDVKQPVPPQAANAHGMW